MKMKELTKFIKASISSAFTAMIDLVIFTILSNSSKSLLIIELSTIIARVISTTINFIINKKIVFKTIGNTKKEIILFFILFLWKMLFSGFLVWLFKFIHINQTILKMFVDISLFLITYQIQNKFIFKKKLVD